MDLNLKERLRTTVLLLILSRIIYTKGLSNNVHCVNDYESTINCALQRNLSTDVATWLKLESKYDDEELKCHLSWDDDSFKCSVEYDAFVDTDVYKIFLCYEGESCELLDEDYSPVLNIKPKPPCCLTLEQNSSQHRFSWKSTYEDDRYTNLPNQLEYQLHFYHKGQQFTGKYVYPDQTTITVRDDSFTPESAYVARVRSSPNQVFYKGQWSDWSTEVHWRTQPTEPTVEVPVITPHVISLKKLLIPLCVLVPIFLSLCFISVQKLRHKALIPTPQPYFHSLYTDCHGDFKSWVIMAKTVDLPKTEKTSHIEKIFECVDIHEEAPSLPQSSEYANTSGPVCTLPEGGLPYAVSTSGLDSATSSCTSAYLIPSSRSPVEWDSGCWLSSDQSLEQGHVWYCNDYCTLSTFQQSALGIASREVTCGTRMVIEHDTLKEIHGIE